MLFPKYNPEKAVQAIIYITRGLQFVHGEEHVDCTRVCRVLYLADKTSLESYARFICGDSYIATADGPVPEGVHALMVASQDNESGAFRVTNGHIYVNQVVQPNFDWLSGSDTYCLDLIISHFGALPSWYLRQIAKDEAYNLAWNSRTGETNAMTFTSITQMFDDSALLIEHLLSND